MQIRWEHILRSGRASFDETFELVNGLLRRNDVKPQRVLQLCELEDRLLLSGTPVPVPSVTDAIAIEPIPAEDVLVVDEEPSGGSSEFSFNAASLTETTRLELVFIDELATDTDALLAGLTESADTEFSVFVLSSADDGIQQMSAIIATFDDLEAIHVVSHGTGTGGIRLGNTTLTQQSLAAYVPQIGEWHNSLSEDADLLFYGCDLAATDNGRTLIRSLSTITAADVAASDDDTGHSNYEADWQLEYQIGAVETDIAFSQSLQDNWLQKLAVITVTTTTDVIDAADGLTSLREAVIQANSATGADTIQLSAGIYQLTIGSTGEDNAAAGDLDLRSDITIVAAGSGLTTIDGGGIDRVFDIRDGVDISISDVTVRNGNGGTDKGGAFYVRTTADSLTLERVVVANNVAGDGAGIFNKGTLTLTDVTLFGNGSATTDEGGAIHNKEVAILNRVTIDSNIATDGGGIHNDNTATSLTLTNVTLTGNTASNNGGGIYSQAYAELNNTTITLNNAASSGGGIHVNSATMDLQNTIVAGNIGGSDMDIRGTIVSRGFNLIGDSSGVTGTIDTDYLDVDAGLAILADNGGFVETHSLNANSAAIDSGAVTTVVTDATGVAQNEIADIGAFSTTNASAKLYWVEDDKIFRANTDGSAIQQLLSGLGSPNGLAVDISSGKIYWIESDTNSLHRANLDGSASQTLDDTNLVNPQGIGLDVTNDHIYVADDGGGANDAIRRFNLDGTGFTTVVSGLNGLIRDVAANATNNTLYIADFGGGTFNGSIRTTSTTPGSAVTNLVTGQTGPTSVELNVATGTVFWTDNGDFSFNRIMSADISAVNENVQTIANNSSNTPRGIAIDTVNGPVYWSDGAEGTIRQINTDGTSETDIISGRGSLKELVVVNLSMGPVAPTAIAPITLSISENTETSGGTSVGTLTAVDANVGDTFTYTVVGGIDQSAFSTGGTASDELILTAGIIDFESQSSYTIDVQVTDSANLQYVETITINVTDENEAPTISLSPVATSINEFASTTAPLIVATVTVSDDALGTENLFLTGDDAGLFELSGTNLQLVAGAVLDFETNPSLNVIVNVDDATIGSTPDDSAEFTVSVTDSNEAPSVTLTPVVTDLDEYTDTSSEIIIATIVVDDDALGTAVLSLSGTDAAFFQINGNNLELIANTTLEFLTQSLFSVTVQVDDPTIVGSPEGSADYQLTINNTNESPTPTDDSVTVSEDGVTSFGVPGVLANDSDPDESEIGTQTASYNASLDTNGDLVWQQSIGSGFEIDFTGSGVTYTTSPTNPLHSIDAAWVFDGTGGGTLTDYSVLPGEQSKDDASFEFFINPFDTTDRDVLFDTGNDNINTSLVLDGAELQFNVTTDATSQTLTYSGAAITAGQYVHIVANIDPDGAIAGNARPDMQLFVNGVLVDEAVDVDGLIDWTQGGEQVGLGAQSGLMPGPSGTAFEGEIAVFNYFEHTLSTEDVQQNYSATVGVLSVVAIDGNTAAVGDWFTIASGARVRMLADGSFDYDTNDVFNSLSLGDTASDNFTYSVTDGELSATATVTVTVEGQNDAPVLGGFATTIDENLADSTFVGQMTVSDPEGQSVTWQITAGNTDNAFAIDSSGNLTVNNTASLDFETNPSFQLTIEATDTGSPGLPATANAEINLLNINEAPTVSLTPIRTNVDEHADTSLAIPVATVNVADDSIGSETLSLTGTNAAMFQLNGNVLELSAGSVLDFQTQPTLSVQIEIDDPTLGVGAEDSISFVLTINDSNDAPTITVTQIATSLDEDKDTSLPTVIATIVVNDDVPGSQTLSLSGADASLFELNGNTLQLVSGTTLDFETLPNLDVTVSVDDTTLGTGVEDSQTVSVTINDINEAPALSVIPIVTSVTEDTDTSSVIAVATISVTDDAIGSNTLALTGADAGLFQFNAGSNQLQLRAGVSLDFQADSSLDVSITLDDTTLPGGVEDSVAFSLNVTDINQSPSIAIDPVALTIDENSDVTISRHVANITVTDDSTGVNNLTLSGADSAVFEIQNGSELHLKAGTLLDFEAQALLSVTVGVDDGTLPGSPEDSETFTLSILDVNEAPEVAISPVQNSVNEGPATLAAIHVATINVTDDALGSVSISLSGTDAGLFQVSGTQLQLAAGVDLDFETMSAVSVTVNIDDPLLGTTVDDSATFTLQVNDVNEVPSLTLTPTRLDIDENADTSVPITVATLVVNDDALGTRQLSLTGTDRDLFEIIGNALQLRADSDIDFETQSRLVVTVSVDDPAIGQSPDDQQTFVLNVIDVNEPPSLEFTPLVTTIAENQQTLSPTNIGTLRILDDAIGSNVLELKGANAELFQISGNILQLKVGVGLDFEALPTLGVTVQLSDLALTGGPIDQVGSVIVVTDVDETPVADSPISVAVSQQNSVTQIDLLDGAIDPDSDPLTINKLTRLEGDDRGLTWNGTQLLLDPTAYQYLPEGQTETIVYTFQVSDPNGNFVTQTASINVTGTNDQPVTTTDSYSGAANESLLIDGLSGVLANDFDPDNSALTATLTRQPTNGVVSLSADGGFQYTPNPGFYGKDSFAYAALDQSTQSEPASVTLQIDLTVLLPITSVTAPETAESSTQQDSDDSDSKQDTTETQPQLNIQIDSLFPTAATAINQQHQPQGIMFAPETDTLVAARANQQPGLIEIVGSRTRSATDRHLDHPNRLPRLPRDSFDIAQSTNDTYRFLAEPGVMWNQFDSLGDDLDSSMKFQTLAIGSAGVMTSGLTIGYVVWILRGGVLLSSILAQMPAWQLIDPMVILNHIDDEEADENDSLESILESKVEPPHSEVVPGRIPLAGV